jgi:hypothetical protein
MVWGEPVWAWRLSLNPAYLVIIAAVCVWTALFGDLIRLALKDAREREKPWNDH